MLIKGSTKRVRILFFLASSWQHRAVKGESSQKLGFDPPHRKQHQNFALADMFMTLS